MDALMTEREILYLQEILEEHIKSALKIPEAYKNSLSENQILFIDI